MFGIHSEDDAVAFRLSATFAVLHLCRNPVLEGELPNKLYTVSIEGMKDSNHCLNRYVHFTQGV